MKILVGTCAFIWFLIGCAIFGALTSLISGNAQIWTYDGVQHQFSIVQSEKK